MYSKKETRVIKTLSAFCVFFALTACVRATFSEKGKGLPGTETVLMNTRYLSSLEEITIAQSGKSIRLFLKNGVWFGTDGALVFPANNKIVAELVNALTEKRTVYHVTDTVSLRQKYGLDGANAVSITAKTTDCTIATELYFGLENFNASKRAFCTGKKLSVYQTTDDLYSFLHTDAKNWADMLVFPEKTLPFLPEDVIRCTLDGVDVTEDSYIDVLRTARCSAIIDAAPFVGKTPLNVIRVETLHDLKMVQIFRNGDSYVLVHGEPRDARYALEVSEWTYNRLILKKNS